MIAVLVARNRLKTKETGEIALGIGLVTVLFIGIIGMTYSTINGQMLPQNPKTPISFFGKITKNEKYV